MNHWSIELSKSEMLLADAAMKAFSLRRPLAAALFTLAEGDLGLPRDADRCRDFIKDGLGAVSNAIRKSTFPAETKAELQRDLERLSRRLSARMSFMRLDGLVNSTNAPVQARM